MQGGWLSYDTGRGAYTTILADEHARNLSVTYGDFSINRVRCMSMQAHRSIQKYRHGFLYQQPANLGHVFSKQNTAQHWPGKLLNIYSCFGTAI